jgi:hypothetical protein
MFYYALIDESTGVFSPGDMAMMLAFADRWADYFLSSWGLSPMHGEIVDKLQNASGCDVLFTWRNEDKLDPNVAGFHSEIEGIPYVELLTDPFMKHGAGIFNKGAGPTPFSLLSLFLHELGELLVDEFIDDWIRMDSGLFIAKEVSDPVQTIPLMLYLDNGMEGLGSNAVTPRYFDNQAPSDGSVSFDLAGEIRAPFELHPGGYQILFDPSRINDPNGPISNVFGYNMPMWLQEYKRKHHNGRTAKRNRRRG